MPQKLYLYEALELRSEYDARITALNACFAESESRRRGFSLRSDDDETRKPSPDFDPVAERASVRALEFKRRKLNSAIQKANFQTEFEFEGETVNLLEALELRKSLNKRIGENCTAMSNAAYQTIIYKEGRDIVQENDIAYSEAKQTVETARLSFRQLNRLLRHASFTTEVDFIDE
jgi:hypothetical protein